MLNLFSTYIGLPQYLVRTSFVLCLLAFVVNNLVVIGASVGESALVSQLGSKSLPFGYIALAALSFSLSLVLTRFIDCIPKTKILYVSFCCLIAFTGIGWLFLKLQGSLGIYISFGGLLTIDGIFFIVLLELLGERLNPVNVKKIMGIFAAFTSFGGMTGGALVNVLSDHIALHHIVLSLLPFSGIGMILCRQLTDDHVKANEEGPSSILESLNFLPKMMRYNRVIPFLYISCFSLLSLKTILSYGYFSIYESHYPNPEDLSHFLGSVYLFLNSTELLISLLFTGIVLLQLTPIIKNMIYPIMAFMGCALLFFTPLLSFAIYAQFIVQSLKSTIYDAVKDQNYNAIPGDYAGRTRVVEDGILAPLTLATMGLLLAFLQTFVSVKQIMIVGSGLAILMMASAFKVGRYYLAQLTHNLKSGALLDSKFSEASSFMINETFLKEVIQSSNKDDSNQALRFVILKLDKSMLMKMQHLLIHIKSADQACINHMIALILSLSKNQQRHLLGVGADQVLTPFWETVFAAVIIHRPDLLTIIELQLSKQARDVIRASEHQLSVDISANPGQMLAIMHGSAQPHFLKTLEFYPGYLNKTILSIWMMNLKVTMHDVVFLETLAISWSHHENSLYRFASCILWERIYGITKSPAPIYHLLNDRNRRLRLRALETIVMIETDLERLHSAISLQSRYLLKQLFDKHNNHVATSLVSIIRNHLNETRRLLPYKEQIKTLENQIPLLCLEDMEKTVFRYLNDILCSIGKKSIAREVLPVLQNSTSEEFPLALEALSNLGNQNFIVPFINYFESLLIEVRIAFSNVDDLLVFIDLTKNETMTNFLQSKQYGLHQDFEGVSIMDLLVALKQTELFKNLSLDELYAVVQEGTVKHYLPGDVIINKGDTSQELYIILKGGVGVMDDEVKLASLNQSEFFGEISLFTDHPRTASIIATVETDVFVLDQEDFKEAVYNEPGVVMDICRLLSNRLIATNAKAH